MDALAALGQEADIKGIMLLTRFDPAGGTGCWGMPSACSRSC